MSARDEKDVIEFQNEQKPEVVHYDPEAGDKLHRHGVTDKADEVAGILAAAGGEQVDYTAAEKKRLLRKIDFYVCVPMCLTYFIQQVNPQALRSTDCSVDGQIVTQLGVRIQSANRDRLAWNSILVAQLVRILCSTHLPTLIFLRPHRVPG